MKINNVRIAAVILIFALVISQVTLYNKIENLENLNMNLQNMLYGIQSSVSQQNYMITTEKADYLIQGISCDKVKINKKVNVLNLTMSVLFDKLPADAIVSLEYRGTTNHLPSMKMEPVYSTNESVNTVTYGSPQTITLLTPSTNLYESEINLDLGQNYEFSILIETKDASFREVIGIIPALEWADPDYSVKVEMKELSVMTPDNGRFEYTAKLDENYLSFDEYAIPYGKVLYNFQGQEYTPSAKVSAVTFNIYYKDALIDQGKLVYNTSTDLESPAWEISDVCKFKADIKSDTTKDLRIDFAIGYEDGKTKKSTWWADGMIH